MLRKKKEGEQIIHCRVVGVFFFFFSNYNFLFVNFVNLVNCGIAFTSYSMTFTGSGMSLIEVQGWALSAWHGGQPLKYYLSQDRGVEWPPHLQ